MRIRDQDRRTSGVVPATGDNRSVPVAEFGHSKRMSASNRTAPGASTGNNRPVPGAGTSDNRPAPAGAGDGHNIPIPGAETGDTGPALSSNK